MELVQLTTRAKMVILLAAGYPILTFVSIIILSYCVDSMQAQICKTLISNIQSVWTMWIICTVLVLLMLVFGRRPEEKDNDK